MRINIILLILWTVIMLTLTLLPGTYIAKVDVINVQNFDKIVHLLIFLIFAFLFYNATVPGIYGQRLKYLPILVTFFISVGYGVLIEVFQRYIPGRNSDSWDVAADAAGALFGIVIVIIKKNIIERKIN